MLNIDSKDKVTMRAHPNSRSSKALWRKVLVSAHIKPISDPGTFPKIGLQTTKPQSLIPAQETTQPSSSHHKIRGKTEEWLKRKRSVKIEPNMDEGRKISGLMLPKSHRGISSSSWSLAVKEGMQCCHAISLREVLPGTAQLKKTNRSGKWMANTGQQPFTAAAALKHTNSSVQLSHNWLFALYLVPLEKQSALELLSRTCYGISDA